MERYRTCCFTGHRSIPEESREKIAESVEKNVEKLIMGGFDTFICGGAVGFDMMCGKVVLALKKKHEHIKLIMAIPCREQSMYFGENDRADYMYLVKNADQAICLSEHYYNGCMHERNRFMVDNSCAVVYYCTKRSGGTYYTCCYAKKAGISLISVI